MSRPIIGLSCYNEPAKWGAWELPAALIPWNYVQKIQDAGASVVILPPDMRDSDAVGRLDGLVLAGGADIDPIRYGEDPHETVDTPRTARDASELGLYLKARELDIPVLGICRGLQIMTVAHGGSLHQHLPEIVGNTLHRDAPGTFNNHTVILAEGSMIASLVGATEVVTNSSHHQAVKTTGDLVATGWASDGIIEVCEDPSAEFALGVQWHPEFSDDPAVSENIFAGLMRAITS